MNFETYERTQTIWRSPEAVAAYLGDVENLPEWNRFFVAVGATEGERTLVATPFGLVRTRVDVCRDGDDFEVAINSIIRGREEVAHMRLCHGDGCTTVRFHLSLPVSMPTAAVEEMLIGLETNLATLAVILDNDFDAATPACA